MPRRNRSLAGPNDALAERQRKTPLTAVVLIPPEDEWEPIQRIRRLHDPQVSRWMPHITLLFPFLPHGELPWAVQRISAVAAAHPPLVLELASFNVFSHHSGRITLWLAPEPREPIMLLQAALQELFPHCDDVSRYPEGFRPHLSVGTFLHRSAAKIARDANERAWRPLRFTIEELSVIARSGFERDPFEVVATIPLGSRDEERRTHRRAHRSRGPRPS